MNMVLHNIDKRKQLRKQLKNLILGGWVVGFFVVVLFLLVSTMFFKQLGWTL